MCPRISLGVEVAGAGKLAGVAGACEQRGPEQGRGAKGVSSDSVIDDSAARLALIGAPAGLCCK